MLIIHDNDQEKRKNKLIVNTLLYQLLEIQFNNNLSKSTSLLTYLIEHENLIDGKTNWVTLQNDVSIVIVSD